jgi:hypothetical protein
MGERRFLSSFKASVFVSTDVVFAVINLSHESENNAHKYITVLHIATHEPVLLENKRFHGYGPSKHFFLRGPRRSCIWRTNSRASVETRPVGKEVE